MAKRQQALRFTSIRLTNWRNFRDAEMRLEKRAFITGPNASGKSNLLDAIRFLRDIAKPTGGLAAALTEFGRNGLTGVRSLHARDPSHLEFQVDVGNDDATRRWTYVLRISRVGREKDATVIGEIVQRDGVLVAHQSRDATAADPLLFSQTLMEQVQKNGAFRELVEFFNSIRYLHVVPQIVRDGRRALAVGDDPHGGDLLRRIKDTPRKMREPRLKRIQEAVALAIPQFESLELVDDADGRPHLQAGYKHWRGRAAKQSEEVFSDGTLRLIGFLWSISEPGGPLLLEEPELSLHEAVVGKLPAMIARSQSLSGRQVICTTHSEALLSAPGVAPKEVHRLVVGRDGSTVETVSDNPKSMAQIREGGLTIGQAVLPLTMPETVNQLADVKLVPG